MAQGCQISMFFCRFRFVFGNNFRPAHFFSCGFLVQCAGTVGTVFLFGIPPTTSNSCLTAPLPGPAGLPSHIPSRRHSRPASTSASSASGRGPAPRVVILAPTHILVRQICGEVAKVCPRCCTSQDQTGQMTNHNSRNTSDRHAGEWKPTKKQTKPFQQANQMQKIHFNFLKD